MRKLVVILAGVVAAVAASLIMISQAGAAPDQTGQTFAEAKAALANAGYAPVVSSSVGDKVAQDDCLVVRQQTTTAPPFVGGGVSAPSSKPRVLLSLNCDPPPKPSS